MILPPSVFTPIPFTPKHNLRYNGTSGLSLHSFRFNLDVESFEFIGSTFVGCVWELEFFNLSKVHVHIELITCIIRVPGELQGIMNVVWPNCSPQHVCWYSFLLLTSNEVVLAPVLVESVMDFHV